jgi:class 3 adenylate cyclase
MSEGPAKTKVPRRLAAILAADIAGYSALMSADEARTVRDLKGQQAVVLPIIKEHGGRIVDTAGEGWRRIQASRPRTERWQLPLRTSVGSTRREPLSPNCAI